MGVAVAGVMAVIMAMAVKFVVRMMNNAAAGHRRRTMMRPVVGGGVLDARLRALPGKARARAGQHDQAGQNGAQQREKDDRLIHALSLSSY